MGFKFILTKHKNVFAERDDILFWVELVTQYYILGCIIYTLRQYITVIKSIQFHIHYIDVYISDYYVDFYSGVVVEDTRYCWKLFVSLKKVWWAEYQEEEEPRQPAGKQHYKGLITDPSVPVLLWVTTISWARWATTNITLTLESSQNISNSHL